MVTRGIHCQAGSSVVAGTYRRCLTLPSSGEASGAAGTQQRRASLKVTGPAWRGRSSCGGSFPATRGREITRQKRAAVVGSGNYHMYPRLGTAAPAVSAGRRAPKVGSARLSADTECSGDMHVPAAQVVCAVHKLAHDWAETRTRCQRRATQVPCTVTRAAAVHLCMYPVTC
jgi:hypothetical protein